MKSFSDERLIFFCLESSRLPTFWILPKLHELCESCRGNPLETLE